MSRRSFERSLGHYASAGNVMFRYRWQRLGGVHYAGVVQKNRGHARRDALAGVRLSCTSPNLTSLGAVKNVPPHTDLGQRPTC